MNYLSLNDLINKMNDENYFKSEEEFYVDSIIDKNQVIFVIPRDRITPRQIHHFKYLESKNTIQIKSKYKNWFFPTFIAYLLLPLLPIILSPNEITIEYLKITSLILLGLTFFITIFAFVTLYESSKHIERELSIRVNYLLRKKGYQTGI